MSSPCDREYVGTERQPVAGRVRARLAFLLAQQPHDVGTPVAGLLGGEAVGVHEVLRAVGQRRVDGHAEPLDQELRVALVPGRGEHDRRLAAGGEVHELARHGQRIEEQQLLTVVDRVGGNVLAPRLGRLPLRMWCLPVPQARTQLAHGAMLLNTARFQRPSGRLVLIVLRCAFDRRYPALAPLHPDLVFGSQLEGRLIQTSEPDLDERVVGIGCVKEPRPAAGAEAATVIARDLAAHLKRLGGPLRIDGERAARLLSAIRAMATPDMHRVTANAVADSSAKTSAGMYS